MIYLINDCIKNKSGSAISSANQSLASLIVGQTFFYNCNEEDLGLCLHNVMTHCLLIVYLVTSYCVVARHLVNTAICITAYRLEV